MGAFDAIDIAQTGADVSQLWLEAIAHNIANVNTIRSADEEPFRALLVHAEEELNGAGVGEGTRAVQILRTDAEPVWVFDPEHPLASEEGYVVRPAVDLAKEMADMIAAQRSYQMNLQVIKTNEETYQAALRIGR
ncbi:MAG: flagellar basal body rod protein FlgC [Acidimicrobiia bacterium]|nr:flagellar basal body rod protein FlgC [Acidimicrobiia bacterium]